MCKFLLLYVPPSAVILTLLTILSGNLWPMMVFGKNHNTESRNTEIYNLACTGLDCTHRNPNAGNSLKFVQ